jgi:hypothetical protein
MASAIAGAFLCIQDVDSKCRSQYAAERTLDISHRKDDIKENTLGNYAKQN